MTFMTLEKGEREKLVEYSKDAIFYHEGALYAADT